MKGLELGLQEMYADLSKLFSKNSRVEKGFLEDDTAVYFVNGELSFFEKENHFLPFIRIILKNLINLPKVTVDTGAVPYMVNGADVMIPGITDVEDSIKKDEYVVIVDEKHNKALAIGIALMDASEIKKSNKGKAVKNLHYVGDKYWDLFSNK